MLFRSDVDVDILVGVEGAGVGENVGTFDGLKVGLEVGVAADVDISAAYLCSELVCIA